MFASGLPPGEPLGEPEAVLEVAVVFGRIPPLIVVTTAPEPHDTSEESRESLMKIIQAHLRGLVLGILVVVTAGIFMLVRGTVATHAQSRNDQALARQFVGTWRLIANPKRLVDGTTTTQSPNMWPISSTPIPIECAS